MKSGNTVHQIKESVREKYTRIATHEEEKGEKPCCGNIISGNYSTLPGYVQEADLGLGCGLPTQYSDIKNGDVVVDLGSGAGNDCFIARSMTGELGQVIGIDFTKKMVEKAQINAKKMGFDNVKFILSDLEEIPLQSGTVDVVISNCVLNLVDNKRRVFEEIFRILKKGKHFIVSDIVLEGHLPKGLIEDMEEYVGCIAGSLQKEDYLKLIKYLAFENIEIKQEKRIEIPEHILSAHLSKEERLKYTHKGVFSITIRGEKPPVTYD